MARLGIWVVAAAAAVLAVGVVAVWMWSSSPRPARQVAVRLMPEGSESMPASSALFWDEIEVARYSFDSPEAIAAWTPERIDRTYDATENGLRIRSSSPDPALWREVSLDASRVSALRVSSSGLTADSYMQLYWAGPDEPFAEDRTLSVNRDDGTGSLLPTFTFPVSGHPRWQGHIGRLRVDPTSTANCPMGLFAVTALDYAVREDLVAAMVEQSFRVDLKGDVRQAVLAPPAHPFVREIDVPDHAQLRFALGLEPGISEPVHFRVVANDHLKTAVLLSETLGTGTPRPAGSWHERTVDLEEFAGRLVQLRFETQSAEDLDLLSGFPAFAGLDVVVPAGDQPRPNVVMIVLDTLRADRLSLYGYGRPTSPRIDTWARERAVVFDRVVAPAPWTLPSHASLFTGLDSVVHGAHTDEPVSESLVTIAERLWTAGYVTRAVTGGGYLASEYGLMQGFDRVSYYFEPKLDPEQSGNDIESGIQRALGWLDTLDERPFFLFFHTYETHSPYRAREPHFEHLRGRPWAGEPPLLSTVPREPRQDEGFLIKAWLQKLEPGPTPEYRQLEPADLPLLHDLYDSEVAFADSHVGLLLDRLVQLGLDDNTIVIITSDHGESLGEHGLAGHSSLRDCELLVPLIVVTHTRMGAGTRISTQVRLLDVAPTLLDLLDLEPLEDVEGVSLVPLLLGGDTDVPDEAWSYAGSSNFGLGLRLADGVTYTYNNSPWRPIAGDETLERPDKTPISGTETGAVSTSLAALRGRAREHYQTATSGLRVSISNREEVPLDVALKGRLVSPLQIKAFDFTGVNVDWRSQTFFFTLPPGQSTTLWCEGRVFGELRVDVRPHGVDRESGRLRRVVDLDVLGPPFQAALSGGTWIDDPSSDLARVTGVRVAIEGSRVRYRPGIRGISRELHEQLRHLGYVQ